MPSGNAAALIFETMQYVYKMEPFELGPLKLRESVIGETEGMQACQEYGKVFSQKLGA